MGLVRISARIRGLFAGNYPENQEDQQPAMNNRGDVAVAQSLPELTELVRLGGTYQVALATGLAALTALPTTTAGLSLYNGEPANGKCFAIDSFGSWEAVADATQSDLTALFAMNNARTSILSAPAATALTVRSMSGKIYGGNGKPITTATVVNDGWFAHGAEAQSTALPAAAAGAQWKVNEARVRGLYLVPPGGQFNIQAVKASAAAAAQQFFFIRWHEVQLIYAT